MRDTCQEFNYIAANLIILLQKCFTNYLNMKNDNNNII